jgi:hypothetical protein
VTVFDAHADEAMTIVAEDRGALLERLFDRHRDKVTTSGRIIPAPSLWPTKGQPRKAGLLRWEWQVTDEATGEVLDAGRALTEPWAWHKTDAAADRIYQQRLAAAAEAEAAEQAEGGCE